MTETEWAARMTSCKNYAIEEMNKMWHGEKDKTITGLFFEATYHLEHQFLMKRKHLCTTY